MRKIIINIDPLVPAFFISILGLTVFWGGFHSIDLAQHYYTIGNWKDFLETTLNGNIETIDEIYVKGLNEISFGMIFFGMGAMIFGIELGKRGLRGGSVNALPNN